MFSLFISFFANLNVCLWLIIIAFYFFAHIFDYLKLWTVRVYLFSIFIFLILETNKEINKDVTFFYNLPSCTYSLTNSLTLLAHFVSNRYTIYKYTNIQICQFIHFIYAFYTVYTVYIRFYSLFIKNSGNNINKKNQKNSTNFKNSTDCINNFFHLTTI